MTGPLIVDIQGLELNTDDHDLLINPFVAGVILFSRNYSDLDQLKVLTETIKNLPRAEPLFISVDHEGGRVQRFREGFTPIPPMRQLGQYYEEAPEKALYLSEEIGFLMTTELLQSGVDFSYAPVLDRDFGINPMLGDRLFHGEAPTIIALASALIRGIQIAGSIVVGKHFPGHGAVAADSHLTLPLDKRQLDAFWAGDLQPFAELAHLGQLPAVMTAHVLYPEIDPDIPCFSSFWLQQILREQLHFQGLIISDDLSMAGATYRGNYSQRAKLALEAGCDLLLLCNNRSAVYDVIRDLPSYYRFNQRLHTLLPQLNRQSALRSFNQERLLQARALLEAWRSLYNI